MVEEENNRLNKAREALMAQKAGLEERLRASKDATLNVDQIERFVREINGKLPNLDLEGKRQALAMLGTKVWLDGENVEINCLIEPEKQGVHCSFNQEGACAPS